MKTDQQMVRWALEESPEPIIKNPYLRSAFRGGQLVQPRQGFYRKGFVKQNRLTKEEIDQRYKEKKLKENPSYKAEIDRRWKAKKLREDPNWTPYKASTHYKRRLEAKEKGLVYDMDTGKFRKAKKKAKYNKFVEAADKKIISGWKKSLTDAAKAGDMSETLGFKTYLTKKYGNKEAQTIRNRVRLQLNFAPGEVSDTIQENFIDSLVKKHNESDKALYSKKDIFDKVVIDRNLGRGREIYFNLDNRLENLDTKINKAFDKIVDNNLLIKASKKATPHVATYSPITQMISEISGAGSNRTIQEALLKNPKFKDKEFVDTFKYLSRAHAKDLVGLPFDEAFEYAKMRQGGLDVKGLISYTTRYQNPESNIMNFAVRHANRHFRDGTKSQVQFYKLRADGTQGAPMPWDKLPKNRDGNRILDLKKVGFEYKNQFFHRNNLKTKGYKSGLFDEVYAMSGKNRLLVPDPENLSNKITLKKLLHMTGDKLTLGHDEALGGVKGAPFKNLRLQGEKLNTALFNAYDKIQNKDLRARVLNSLEGQFKGLSGGDYQKAFIEGKTKEAQDILSGKVDLSKRATLYREAGQKIVDDPVFKTFSPKKQREAMRIAGNKIVTILDDAGIECIKGAGGNCTSPEDFRKGFNQVVERAAANDKTAISKLQKFTKTMKKLKGPLKWTGYGILGEIGFMVPFGVADYTTGESWKRIMGNASDWGFGPMFGQSEDEEIIANLPEGSLGAEGQEALAASERLRALEDPNRNFPKGRIGMDPRRFQKAQAKVIPDAALDLRNKLTPFMEGPRNEFLNIDKADQSMMDWVASQELIKAQKEQRIQERRDRGFIAEEGWEKNMRMGRMGGGIANVRRPWAVPPVSGPVPQGGGLSTMFNRVKPW